MRYSFQGNIRCELKRADLDLDPRSPRIDRQARAIPTGDESIVGQHTTALERIAQGLQVADQVAEVAVAVEDRTDLDRTLERRTTPLQAQLPPRNARPHLVGGRWNDPPSAAHHDDPAVVLLGPRCPKKRQSIGLSQAAPHCKT